MNLAYLTKLDPPNQIDWTHLDSPTFGFKILQVR